MNVVFQSMDVTEFVPSNAVIAGLKAGSKKQVLHALAGRAAQLTGLDELMLLEKLLERERLGSTGVGHGVAIPHAKFSQLKSVFGLVARLRRPVEFDSVDDEPVDLVFLLLAPEGAGTAHLKALARVSRLLRNRIVCARLREAKDSQAMYAVLRGTSEDLREPAAAAR